MKMLCKLFFTMIILLCTTPMVADTQVRTSPNKDIDPAIAYNFTDDEYLVTASLSGKIIGQRVSNTGTLQGSPIGLISKTNSIYLNIFDVLGREVKTPLNNSQLPGN